MDDKMIKDITHNCGTPVYVFDEEAVDTQIKSGIIYQRT